MLKNPSINLKICGITSLTSIKIAAKNNINSLGFVSNNLAGPNTCDDQKIRSLIKECNKHNIESVLLTRHQNLNELVKQINYTKPKTISCSYFFSNSELIYIKSKFKKLKIGISINPKKFKKNYFNSIFSTIDIFYYDLNVYSNDSIKTYSINNCIDQINYLKKLNITVYIGGGINLSNIKNIINLIKPNGIDISRSLKDAQNNISLNKLNKLRMIFSAVQ